MAVTDLVAPRPARRSRAQARTDGSQAFAWDGRCALRRLGIVLRAAFNVDVIELGYTTFRRGDEVHRVLLLGPLYNVFQVSSPDGTLKVVRQRRHARGVEARRSANSCTSTLYYVWANPDGEFVVLDQEEFDVLLEHHAELAEVAQRGRRRAARVGRGARAAEVAGDRALAPRLRSAPRSPVGVPRRTLTVDGAVAAAGVGTVVVAAVDSADAHPSVLRVLQCPLARGSVAQAAGQGARRDAWQVLANGGAATAAMALGRRSAFVAHWPRPPPTVGDGGSACSRPPSPDSRSPTLQSVLRDAWRRGTEGFVASLGGALTVGIAAGRSAWALIAGASRGLIAILLGATLQALYACDACGARIEEPRHAECDSPATLLKGIPAANNDTVRRGDACRSGDWRRALKVV